MRGRRVLRRRGRKYTGPRRGRRGVRLITKKTHWFKETCQITSIDAPAAGNNAGVMTFRLTDLNNANNYRQLFDLYKITGVKIKIVPKVNSSDATVVSNANTQSGTLPMLYIAPNRDPYVPAPGGVADILNDDGVKIIRMTRPVNLYLKAPKALIFGGNGLESIPLQFNVGSKWQPWLTTGGNTQSVDQSGLQHFGYRWYINNGVGHFDQVFDVYATYYFAMKELD